jgi:NADH-quinone oxidoreductase subunit A
MRRVVTSASNSFKRVTSYRAGTAVAPSGAMRLAQHPSLAILVYLAAALAVIAAMLLVSHFAGERRDRSGEQPYESGMLPTGSAEAPVSVRFYLIAMLFLIFDVEAAFVLAWTVAVRELGWAGFAEAALFIAVLVAAWLYVWRVGALDWGTTALLASRRREERRRREEPRAEEVGGEVVAQPGR